MSEEEEMQAIMDRRHARLARLLGETPELPELPVPREPPASE